MPAFDVLYVCTFSVTTLVVRLDGLGVTVTSAPLGAPATVAFTLPVNPLVLVTSTRYEAACPAEIELTDESTLSPKFGGAAAFDTTAHTRAPRRAPIATKAGRSLLAILRFMAVLTAWCGPVERTVTGRREAAR